MTTEERQPGYHHALGDPEGTVRYWDGYGWIGQPVRRDSVDATAESDVTYGDLGVRMGAALIDGVMWAIVFFIIVTAIAGGDPDSDQIVAAALVVFLLLVLVSASLVAAFGGTPGKLILGLRVTTEDGVTTPPGARRALRRSLPNFVGLLPGLGPVLNIALLVMNIYYVATDDERRSVFDRFGGTRVVRI